MRTLLTLLIVGAMFACQVEQVNPTVTETEGVAKGYHPCLDALVADLEGARECIDLKALHPNCYGCDFAAEGSDRDAQTAWDNACAALECEWCAADPFVCD